MTNLFPRTNWAVVIFVVVIFNISFGSIIEYLLFPTFSWFVPSGWNFAWVNSWVGAGVIVVMALDAYLRSHTRVLVACDKTFQLAYYSPKNTQSRNYRLDRAFIRKTMRVQFSDSIDKEAPISSQIRLAPPRRALPAGPGFGNGSTTVLMDPNSRGLVGTDASGNPVTLVALMLGGIDHGGIHLRGRDGILLVYGGETEFIRFGSAHKGTTVVLPRMLHAVPHNSIDPEVYNQLREIDGFHPNKTPIFLATSWDPGFLEYIKNHADVIKPIVDGVDLTKIHIGRPDDQWLWFENVQLRSELHRARLEKENLDHANRAYSEERRGKAERSARAYRAGSNVDPTLALASRAPIEEDDED